MQTYAMFRGGYAARRPTRLGALNPAAVFIGKPYELKEILVALQGLTAGHGFEA